MNKVLKRLFNEIKQYKIPSIITISCTFGAVFFEILIPYVISMIIDKGVEQGNISNIMKYGIIMLALAFAGLACGIGSGFFGAKASCGFAANLRQSMYENIQRFSFANIDKYSTPGLITRLTTDVTNVQNAYLMCIRLLLRAPAMIFFAMTMTIVISPSLSLIFLAAIIILGVILFLLMRAAMKSFTVVFDKYDDLNESIQENVRNIRVVKAFVQEGQEKSKFNKAAWTLYKLFVKAEQEIVIVTPLLYFMIYSCILLLSWFGAKMIVGGSLTTGQLTSLFSYTMNIMISLMILSFTAVMVIISEASALRIVEVLEEKSDIVSGEAALKNIADGSIEFKDVCFSYSRESKKPVLEDINLNIASGQSIGILGGTGSSKSSLISLVSRLYDVSSGEVRVGGVNVKEYDIEALRNGVSVVLQKNELFSGTVLENLRWGNENAGLEECQRACRIACADEFIEKLAEGYNTHVERGGANFSGGQKQRLCIARALLKNPKILILDDSTSAVDTATDAKIKKAFKTELPEVTKIIISQRISSIKEADSIIVMEDGKINAVGTHEELVKTNEIYSGVYAAQNESGGDFDRMED